jgi:carbonic anhydrase
MCELTQFAEVIVHRNAGGNVRYALRDIEILDTLFVLDELVIIHHTDCGTLHFTDDQIREAIKSRTNKAHWETINQMEFGQNKE